MSASAVYGDNVYLDVNTGTDGVYWNTITTTGWADNSNTYLVIGTTNDAGYDNQVVKINSNVTLSFAKLNIGGALNGSGDGELIVEKGGKLTINTVDFRLGNNGVGTLTIQEGGEVIASEIWAGNGSGTGIVNINGGTFTLTGGRNFLILGQKGSAEMNITAGTLTVKSYALQLAKSGQTATITQTGGTANYQNGIVVAKIDATATIAVSGGMMTATSIGTATDVTTLATLNISEADSTIATSVTVTGDVKANINVTGSGAEIAMGTISEGNINFVAGDSWLNADGTTSAFSTINVGNYDDTGTTWTAGEVTTTGTVTAELGAISAIRSGTPSTTPETLLTASSISNITLGNAADSLWTLGTEGDGVDGYSIVATLKESAGTLDLSQSISTVDLADAQASGWVALENPTATETYALELEFTSDDYSDWTTFTEFYTSEFDEYANAVDPTAHTITLFGLSLADDSSFLWDLTNYTTNAYSLTGIRSLDSNAIPEPATWTLLILGATALVFMRRKR